MHRFAIILLGAGAVLPAACTPAEYGRQADRAALAVIGAGQQVALGAARPFDVVYRPFCLRADGDGTIRVGAKTIHIGEGPVTVIDLGDSLGIAFRNSRSFQTRKEQLYADALALANARRTWDWALVTGEAGGEASHTVVEKTSETNTGSAGAGQTLTQRFINGGILALGLSLDFATDFLGGSGTTLGSLVEANFTQPLLRGAWRGLAYEEQYRRERDFYFSVFEYERFTQTFAADVVQRYYAVLQQRDELANEAANIERLKETLALTRTLVEGGQVSRIQEDQAEQNLLNAQVRYERNRQNYSDALDGFKLLLGLPVLARVEPNYPADLDALNEAGARPVPMDESAAIAVALAVRPDVLAQWAALRDARRDVELAADEFNPQLDVTVGLSAPSEAPRKLWSVRGDRHTRTVGLTFQYDIDQTDNRDAYREALIAAARSERDLAELLDRVRLEVRQSYRQLGQSRRSYELQRRNVEIARRRRKLANLQQKEGLASARDVLEAEEALRAAQNGLTSALVGYTTTRLTFLARLGMVWVDEKGMVHEREQPFRFDRLERRYGDK
jgi:outer membrane protein TolC